MIDLAPTMAVTCSLVTASVLSLLFSSTRSIGILCVTVLCYFYPYCIMPPILIGTIFYIFNKR